MTADPAMLDDSSHDVPEEDPVVEECIRDALAPYLGVLTPEQIADYRAFITVFITTHPAAAPLYERLRVRRVSAASGEAAREDADADADATNIRTPLDGTFNKRRG